MRILFANFTIIPFGAPDVCWHRAANVALTRDHAVGISVPDWGTDLWPHYSGFKDRGVPLYLRSRQLRPSNLLARQFSKLRHKLFNDDRAVWRSTIGQFKPDVVVLNEPGFPCIATVPGVHEYFDHAPVPYVTMTHYNNEGGALPERVYDRARALYARAAGCVFVSRRNLEVAQRQLCMLLPNAVVIDNPPGFGDWSPIPYPTFPPHRFAMVARLECGIKGQDLVLAAFAQHQWRERTWSLTIAGGGPDMGYLKELVDFYGLQDRVDFAGQVSGIRNLWRSHHMLVLGSTGEGKPLAITEAMVCGRPSVVTDVGDNADLVKEGSTGFVARAATVSAISEALEKAWDRRETWQMMGMRAHDAISSRLSPLPEEVLLHTIETSVSAVPHRRRNN